MSFRGFKKKTRKYIQPTNEERELGHNEVNGIDHKMFSIHQPSPQLTVSSCPQDYVYFHFAIN